MRSLLGFTTLPSLLIGSLAGCSSLADPADELAGNSVDEYAFDGIAGGARDGAYTYFAVTADPRRCPSPLCGGWFLTALNRSKTACHDGRLADRCYTPVLDWSEADLSDEQKATLLDAANQDAVSGAIYAMARGRFAPTNDTPRPEMGRFVITEGWLADGTAPAEGMFVKVVDNGLRCFAAPCPNLTETTVNTPRSADIAAIDFTPAGLTADQLEATLQWLSTPEGIMVAGYRYMVHENETAAKGRTATAVYHRLVDELE